MIKLKCRHIYHIFLALIFILVYAIYQMRFLSGDSKSAYRHPPEDHQIENKSPDCIIPMLNPFNSSIIDLIPKISGALECDKSERFPLLFNSSVNPYPHIQPVKSLLEFEALGIKKCLYQKIIRRDTSDSTFTREPTQYPINLENSTRVPPGHEFIVILCNSNITERNGIRGDYYHAVDMHAFIHDIGKGYKNPENLNVIILGIDSVSRMGFTRSLPKSREYLLEKMGAVEMKAYHKIGENTFPNVAPLLTNLEPKDETELECERSKYFDRCPFIWNKFSQARYTTLFAEDEEFSIFNFDKNGFTKKPTDYYFRPFLCAAEKYISHTKSKHTTGCLGPRTSFSVMIDYMQKLSYLEKWGNVKKYFQFGWSSSVTHDNANGGLLIDEHLLNALKWWNEGGYLENTVFVLMSDHGSRWGEVRKTYQGQLEDRLPFMFISMPKMFQDNFPDDFENLVRNQDRLVTVLDLHQMLLDILQIYDKSVRRDIWNKKECKTGISLFQPILVDRTCNSAGIPQFWCTCNQKIQKISNTSVFARVAAIFALKNINKPLSNYSKCAVLKIENIFQAGEVTFGESKVKSMIRLEDNRKVNIVTWYQIGFTTSPGNATFEALVARTDEKEWILSGRIARTNLFGDQSHCVDDKIVKSYCYCLDLHEKLEPTNTEFIERNKSYKNIFKWPIKQDSLILEAGQDILLVG